MSGEMETNSIDAVGQAIVRIQLGELDPDLRAAFEGVDWQRVPARELIEVQAMRLLRKLVDERNDGTDR